MALDARDQLRKCTHSVLYIAGSSDQIVPARNMEQVVRELPSTKVVTIEGPHLALYTNPTVAIDAIATFMGKCGLVKLASGIEKRR